jgi:hypothetical protein
MRLKGGYDRVWVSSSIGNAMTMVCRLMFQR